jgi:hypothetical protein
MALTLNNLPNFLFHRKRASRGVPSQIIDCAKIPFRWSRLTDKILR